MSGKVIWTGIGLSSLGLGHFLPAIVPVAAIVLMVGVVIMWSDHQ